MNRKYWSLVCFLLLAGAAVGWAQTGAGTIQGTVKDPSDAVVPGAKVKIVQTQTALKRDTTTNASGFFVFPSALIGPYTLTVEAPGMETWNAELTLQAGQTAEIDPVLKVGSSTTEVTVTANATPLVNTTDGTVATVVERARIEQLPLDGRSVDDLIYKTTPGVEPQGAKVPTVYGVLYGSEMTQDGALLENRDWQKLPDRLPGLDTIEEFRAETSNSSAKMERPGTITLTTRHGTNQFHGSIFDTNRDSAFGVARARQDYYDKPPHLVRNEFGASVGGPVYLPKLYNGKSKTFFFLSYEGYRLRQNVTGATSVPTEAMRNGDFSGLVDAVGHKYQLYNPFSTRANGDNPYSRDPFMCDSAGTPLLLNSDNTQTPTSSSVPCNVIPSSLENPVAKYLYNVTPLPTLTNVNPLLGDNFFGLGVNNKNQDTSTVRFDHQFSENNQIFFRYTHSTNNSISANGLNGPGEPAALDGSFNLFAPKGQNDTGVVSWTHTFSPTFFGETLFTLGRDYHAELPGTGTKQFAIPLGLPDPTGFYGFPRIDSTGFGYNYDACGCNVNIARARVWNLAENLTKTRGRHELLFGGQLQYERDDTLPDQQDSAPHLSYDTLATSLYDTTTSDPTNPLAVPFSGSAAANLFLGVATYQIRFNRQFYFERVNSKMLYFQDNFKVSPRLTLNLGVRYEYNSPVHEANNSLIGFDPKTHAVVLQTSIENLQKAGDVYAAVADAYAALGVKYETPAQAGLPQNLVYSNYLDFNPRFGFAYRLTEGKHYSVLRGGYGMFSYPDSLRLWNGDNQFTVPVTGFGANNPNNGAQSPDGFPNYLLRSVPSVFAGVNSEHALDLTGNNVQGIPQGSGFISYLDPHQPTSRAEMWNLTYEKEIAPDTALSLKYIGTHAFRMNQFYSYNDFPSDFVWYMTTGQPKPSAAYLEQPYDQTFGQVEVYQRTGWSNNNSFQIELQHQYSKGYAFQVFYVLSNAFRSAGDGWRADLISAPNVWLPNTVPTNDLDALNRFENYKRDITVPKHHLQWNWIVDLPFGQGKPIGRGAHGFLNALIGGWQLAGDGALYSRYFSLPTDLWGPANGGLHVYGKKYKVEDCRSGQCYDGYLWWNGYIPPNLINNNVLQPSGVEAVPGNSQPFQTPMIPTPSLGIPANDPLAGYYESNTVCVNLPNKSYQVLTATSPCLAGAPGYEITGYSVGPDPNVTPEWQGTAGNPFRNQFLRGPMEWNMDASLFKSFRLGERATVRFNMDFFNVFNRPGTTMPFDDSGIITNQFSDNPPRVMQLSLRLTW